MPGEQNVDRISTTKRFLDKRRNPWEYVDEELPTKTVKIFSRNKQGTILDSASGVTNMGSISFSGSHYDFSPGSYSLRITRRSVHVGSMAPNAQAIWKLRHSREGTVDQMPFGRSGTMQAKYLRYSPLTSEMIGGQYNPIYSFGPGTLWSYFHSLQGTVRVYSSLEGVF